MQNSKQKGITAVQLRSIRLFGLKSKEKKHQRILVIQLKEKLCVVLTSAETESSLWVAS
ncbi:conserved domain protein [Parasutterella excrementihominis YIT 11859]|uniref:Conserved domain protein n=1 Tax=Parasutterella excrementihominis YIT 11859 TaxID=762966 RepID=F3QMP0_9BURK|nr:conserved domain protein [Parasutterella excrementihominis YIT 11859]